MLCFNIWCSYIFHLNCFIQLIFFFTIIVCYLHSIAIWMNCNAGIQQGSAESQVPCHPSLKYSKYNRAKYTNYIIYHHVKCCVIFIQDGNKHFTSASTRKLCCNSIIFVGAGASSKNNCLIINNYYSIMWKLKPMMKCRTLMTETASLMKSSVITFTNLQMICNVNRQVFQLSILQYIYPN